MDGGKEHSFVAGEKLNHISGFFFLQFHEKLNLHIPYFPRKSTFRNLPNKIQKWLCKFWHGNVHSNITYDSYKVDKNIIIDKGMKKANLMYPWILTWLIKGKNKLLVQAVTDEFEKIGLQKSVRFRGVHSGWFHSMTSRISKSNIHIINWTIFIWLESCCLSDCKGAQHNLFSRRKYSISWYSFICW